MSEKVILREENNALGSWQRSVSLTPEGDLLIYGAEKFFGSGLFKYEWTWTVRAAYMPALLKALNVTGDVLEELRARFSGDASSGLMGFLDAHKIKYDVWYRVDE